MAKNTQSLELIRQFQGTGCVEYHLFEDACMKDQNLKGYLCIPKDKVEKYGVLSEKDGKLVGVVEKPKPEEAPSNLINVSKYIMTPDLIKRIVKYVNENDFGPKDQEYMVTDPIDAYIKDGGVMRIATTTGEYLDGGSVEGWLHANNVVCGNKN